MDCVTESASVSADVRSAVVGLAEPASQIGLLLLSVVGTGASSTGLAA